MRPRLFLYALPLLLLFSSCSPATTPFTLQADGKSYTLTIVSRIPANMLAAAGVSLGADDRLLSLGSPVAPGEPLPEAQSYHLVLRRAVALTLVGPDGTQTINSSAATVGEALAEAGIPLYVSDLLDPPAGTPLDGPLTVTYTPARDLTITADGVQVHAHSAAATVAEALAGVGLPLTGLDYSVPPGDSSLPSDGQVRVVRVVEAVALAQKAIPYQTRTELSADLELDQQALLQGGEPGLAIARTRSRMEDGVQVSQMTESESTVRPPQDRVMGFGTKVVIRTVTVDGVTFEYWRALQVYTTYYIPCDAEGRCAYYTSSRTLVRKGEVAMVYPWFLLFAGERLYVPGYGYATVEDTNGAYTSANWGTYWLDMGYGQDDAVDWTNRYVTVYFLTPVPANVASTYVLP